MTSFIAAIFLVCGVIACIRVFGLYAGARQVVRTSRQAMAVLGDPRLGDDRKESLLQGYSLSLLRSCLDLLMRGAGSIVLPMGLLWAMEWAGILSLKAVLALTFSWPVLLSGFIVAIVACWFFKQ